MLYVLQNQFRWKWRQVDETVELRSLERRGLLKVEQLTNPLVFCYGSTLEPPKNKKVVQGRFFRNIPEPTLYAMK